MHIYTHLYIYRKVNFHCPWCPYALIHYRHQLCWPICIERVHSTVQSVSPSHWPTVTSQTHSLLYRQIAYCRKFNAICNSSRASIQSFSIITWSREWVRVYFYCYCSIELHSLRTWCTDTSKHWHKNVELLDSQFFFIYIPLTVPFQLSLSLSLYLCSLWLLFSRKKPLFVYFKKRKTKLKKTDRVIW